MVCVLVTSCRLPTEDIRIRLASGPHISLVSAEMNGYLLLKLSMLIHQFPLPD